MYYTNMCGGYCEPDREALTKEDKKALFEENIAIMEAKIATYKHLIDSLDKKESDKD